MTDKQEQIVKLRTTLASIQYILAGKLTPEALLQLRAYVDRKVKELNED